MTMRIETTSDGQTVVLRLIGRIESMHLDELQAEVRRHRLPLVLDLFSRSVIGADQQVTDDSEHRLPAYRRNFVKPNA